MDNALAQMLNALPQQADANGHHTPYQQQQQVDMNAIPTMSGMPTMPTGMESHGLGTPLSLAAMVNGIQLQPTSTSAKPPKPSGKKVTSKGSGQHKTCGSKNKPLVGIAHDAHLKRLKRLAAESEEALRAAQAAHLVKLRKAAEAEAASRDTVRRSVASWVRGNLGEAEAAVLTQWHDTLKQLLQQANKVDLQEVQYYAHTINPDLNQLMASAAPVELRPPQMNDKQQAEATTSNAGPASETQAWITAEGVQVAVTQTPLAPNVQTGTQQACPDKAQDEPAAEGTSNEALKVPNVAMPDVDAAPCVPVQQEHAQQAHQHPAAADGNQQPTDTTVTITQNEVATQVTSDQPAGQAIASDMQLQPCTPVEQPTGSDVENPVQTSNAHGESQDRIAAEAEKKPDELIKTEKDVSNAKRPASALHSELKTCHTWTYADPYTNQHGIRITMECLREIAALLPPVKAMLTGDLIDTVQQFAQQHPHPAVSGLAKHILGGWQRGVLSRIRALLSPGLLADPVADLEARIANNQIQYPPDILAKVAAFHASNAQLTTPPSHGGSIAQTTPAFNTTSMAAPHQNGGQSFAAGLDLSASLAAAANYNPLMMLGANTGPEGSSVATTNMPNMQANMFGGFPVPGAADANLFNQWFATNPQTAAGFSNTFPPHNQTQSQFDPMMQGFHANGNHVESMDVLQQLAAFSGMTSNQSQHMLVNPHAFQNMAMTNSTNSQQQQPASSFMTGVTEGAAPSTSMFATSMETEHHATPATQDATSKPEYVEHGTEAGT